MENMKLLLKDNELRRKDFDLRNPSRFVVSLNEFKELKIMNDEDVIGLTYEEYCEIEKEEWNSMATELFHKPFELLDVIPNRNNRNKRFENIGCEL